MGIHNIEVLHMSETTSPDPEEQSNLSDTPKDVPVEESAVYDQDRQAENPEDQPRKDESPSPPVSAGASVGPAQSEEGSSPEASSPDDADDVDEDENGDPLPHELQSEVDDDQEAPEDEVDEAPEPPAT